MAHNEWLQGPPPSVGWWPASMHEASDAFRWWDGSAWSNVAWLDDSASEAGRKAEVKARPEAQSLIKWRHRPANWPARSIT